MVLEKVRQGSELMPKKLSIAAFDMDETLSAPYQPPSPEMALLLSKLVAKVPVAIFTGAGLDRIQRDFLPRLPQLPKDAKLYLFPNSGSEAYLYQGGVLKELYREGVFTAAERDKVRNAISDAVVEAKATDGFAPKGEQFIDRGSQIAHAFLGMDTSAEDRAAWDPNGAKRRALQDSLLAKLPEFSVSIAGKTSIDITKISRKPDGSEETYDKAYGLRRLAEFEKVAMDEIDYTGDAFFEGGNDEVVRTTGAHINEINSIEEAAHVIDRHLERLEQD